MVPDSVWGIASKCTHSHPVATREPGSFASTVASKFSVVVYSYPYLIWDRRTQNAERRTQKKHKKKERESEGKWQILWHHDPSQLDTHSPPPCLALSGEKYSGAG